MYESSLTVGEWLQQWITTYAPIRCHSRVTLVRYQQLANYVIHGATRELGQVAHTPLGELTHRDLEPALLSLTTAKAQRTDHLSMRTIRHVGGLLSVALDKAWKLDTIPENPMAKVELPGPEPPNVRALNLEEIQRLREVCRHHWTSSLIEVALATGCRRGELLALEWSDLNPSTRVLKISKSLEETKYGLRIKRPKNGRARACTLPHSTLFALPQRDARGELRRGLMFPGPDGRWMSPALVSQQIVRRMRKAGIRDASLHSLRHTHATTLLSRGLPLPAVASRLGHSDPNITLRIYSHALPLDDHRIAAEWDNVIAEMS